MSVPVDARGIIRAAATMAAMVVLGALPAMTAGAAAQAGPTLRAAAPAGPAAVRGEIVVGFQPGVGGSERAAARSAADVRASRNLLLRGAQLVKVEPGQTVQDAITELERRPDVRYAEPNWIYHATSTTPDDPLFGSLWGLDNTGQAVDGHAAGTGDDDIDAPEAWDRNRGSASTVVALVDTGVAWDHPGSSTAEAHTVNPANTTTTISSDAPDPSDVGHAVTVQYAVAAVAPGVGTPTGNVTVRTASMAAPARPPPEAATHTDDEGRALPDRNLRRRLELERQHLGE